MIIRCGEEESARGSIGPNSWSRAEAKHTGEHSSRWDRALFGAP